MEGSWSILILIIYIYSFKSIYINYVNGKMFTFSKET